MSTFAERKAASKKLAEAIERGASKEEIQKLEDEYETAKMEERWARKYGDY